MVAQCHAARPRSLPPRDRWLFPQDVFADPRFAAKAQAYYDRWEMVGREDVGILERQQRALQSVLYRPGPLSWRDDMVQALGLWVLERLDLV